jgi:drug/metabolite transporter (DMT)-like permease
MKEQIGIIAYMGFIFLGCGTLGLIYHKARGKFILNKQILGNYYFYARWIFFAMHISLLMIGASIVQKEHMPFLILINYLWPTAIIICSILLAGVEITRWWAFALGSMTIITSLTIETLGPTGLSPDLFNRMTDCIAYAMVFCGAISWGLYSALSRRAGETTGGSTVIPIFQLTFAPLLPLSFVPGMATWGHMTAWALPVLAAYSVLQFLAYLSWDFGMRHGNVVALSLCADFIPWLSLLAAHLMLGVSIENKTAFSAILLVIGATITRYGTLKKKFIIDKNELPDM